MKNKGWLTEEDKLFMELQEQAEQIYKENQAHFDKSAVVNKKVFDPDREIWNIRGGLWMVRKLYNRI